MSDESDPPDAPPRRDFLNAAIAGTATALGVAAGYPVVRFLEPTRRAARQMADAGKVDDFPTGTARTLLVGDRAALVIRMGDGSFRAYVALCTHLQCVVGFSAERQRIECKCHNGAYSLDGQNVAGPPPRPLQTLQVAVVDGNVVVSEV